MTPSEFKQLYQIAQPDNTYFGRDEMKFFGDTMGNYKIIVHDSCYELARKRPVKYGLHTSRFFDKTTFNHADNPTTKDTT